jgi:peptidoglycan/LPS O-acetylase OafA/YrhL
MATAPQKSMELIWPELVNRFWAPCKSVTFYSYLLFGVILCGGSGVLMTFLRTNWRLEDVSAALLGYFPALVGAAVLEFTAEYQPYLRSLGVIALGLLLPVVFFAARTEHGWQFFWALIGTLLSILLWWVANGQNERFEDVRPQSALGGDVQGNLSESQDPGWQK